MLSIRRYVDNKIFKCPKRDSIGNKGKTSRLIAHRKYENSGYASAGSPIDGRAVLLKISRALGRAIAVLIRGVALPRWTRLPSHQLLHLTLAKSNFHQLSASDSFLPIEISTLRARQISVKYFYIYVNLST